MAKKRNSKKTERLLLRLAIIGYFVVLYVTCHATRVDLSNLDTVVQNVLWHMVARPFDILPIQWDWVGIITVAYLLLVAVCEVSYEKQKNTMPGEENGSATWNDDFEKFSSKYAEPFGRKEIAQKTGWVEIGTGLPWKKQKRHAWEQEEEGPPKTKSFVVAVFKLIGRKIGKVWAKIKDKWLDLSSKFYWKRREENEEDSYREPTARERKKYEKICALEKKLDMNLDRRKPKACLEEKKRLDEAALRKAMEGERAYELRRRRELREYQTQKPKVKLSATLAPVNRNMILSQNVALSMDGRATRKNCNTLILGGSGAGKTRFYLKPNLMNINCSYVITDPSGEILQTMGKFLENAGYEIKVINLTNMDQSHCYNPFNYVREDADILVMIDVLTKNLTPPDSHSSDPFWPKAQAALLQAICFYLYKECRPSERNFTNVMKLLRAAVISEDGSDRKSPLDIIFADLEEKDPNHIAVMQYSIFKQAPGKTASTILTCAEVDLAPFNLDTIANLTGRDTVDMGTIGLKPTALFCITPTAKTTYNWIISLAYTQLFETLYYTAETQCKGLRLPVHVRFLLDEFANIGQIPDFEQKLATMRKYEISCAIIIQNMAQLETMYKESWKTIVGNCDEFIYLGGHETSSTEYVSKMLGKQTIKSRNSSRTYGRQGSNNISLNATGRDLMDPSEIAHMSDEDCLVMIKGVMPFFDKKYDLLKHPNYKYTGDADENLLFDIAAEIRTPQNDVFGKNRRSERANLEKQAKADTRNADRHYIMGTGGRSPLNVSPENMMAAGLRTRRHNYGLNQPEDMYADVTVNGVHVPEDAFSMPADMKAASEDVYSAFVGRQLAEEAAKAAAKQEMVDETAGQEQELGQEPQDVLENGVEMGQDDDVIGEGTWEDDSLDESLMESDWQSQVPLDDFGDMSEYDGDIEEDIEIDDELDVEDGEEDGPSLGESNETLSEIVESEGPGLDEVGEVGGATGVDAAILAAKETVFYRHLKALNDIDFVIMNVVTTGRASDDEIVELGIIDKNGSMLYASLFNPQKEVSAELAGSLGVDASTLAAAPRFADEWSRIQAVLHDREIVVFHAQATAQALQQTMQRYAMETSFADKLVKEHLDAMCIYLDVRPNGRNSVSLQYCCDALWLDAQVNSRAVDDARLVLEVLKKIDGYQTANPSMAYLQEKRLV